MSNSCVTGRRCGANGPGWLVGGHPSVSEGCARRRVCFASSSGFSGWYSRSSCCRWSTYISVRKCGTFFVYKLRRPPTCYLRYCGDGIPPRTQGKIFCCLNYSVLKRKTKGFVTCMRSIMMIMFVRSSPLSLELTYCLLYHSLVWIYQGLLHSWFL